jgi:hypothetical protein
MRRLVHAGMALFGRLALILAISSLAACGKGGGSSNPAPTPGSNLFVADSGNHSIASFVNSNPSPGPVTADRLLTGSNTNLPGNIPAFALDVTNDRLYVSSGTSVLVFNNASTASGNISPARTAATTGAGNFSSLFLDTTNDRLYAGDGPNGVKVFNSASTLAGNTGPDTPTPSRFLTNFGTGSSIRGVAVDATKNILYVAAVTTAPSIVVSIFDNADAVDAAAAPGRTITIAATSDMGGIFLDSTNDRLYLSDPVGHILVYDTVSAKNDPAATPDRTINLPTASKSQLAADIVNDRLYAAAPGAGGYLLIVQNASTASGPQPTAVELLPPASGDLTAVAVKP